MAPLLDTLKIAEELHGVGFTEAQAKLLAAKFEEVAQIASHNRNELLRAENEQLRSEIRALRAGMIAAN
jgi:hypothetical protein